MAFPGVVQVADLVANSEAGLTKREYFAAAALTGIASRDLGDSTEDVEMAAEEACELADALIAELDISTQGSLPR
jgi:hypothetical protein